MKLSKSFSSAFVLVIASVMGAIFNTACEPLGSDSSGAQSDSSKLKVLAMAMSSQEPSFVEGKISITQVQIRNQIGLWLTFQQEEFDLDLVDLSNGLSKLIAAARLPEGEYDQIRLITGKSGRVQFQDEAEYDLIVPSGQQTGIKVHFDSPVEVVSEEITQIEVVFDLSDSFVTVGNGNSPNGIHHYLFKPVLRVNLVQYLDPEPEADTETPSDSDGTESDSESENESSTDADSDSGVIYFPPIGI